MLAYIPYMDPMGMKISLVHCSSQFIDPMILDLHHHSPPYSPTKIFPTSTGEVLGSLLNYFGGAPPVINGFISPFTSSIYYQQKP